MTTDRSKLAAPRRALRCGGHTLPLGRRTYVMGILNVTDDSFAGGGFLGDTDGALRRAAQFVAAGADILDVGGESARADTPVVPADEETARVAPLIERLVREFAVPVSVDTYKPEVAEAALEAGASLVNDIAGFTLGDGTARAAARAGAAFVVNYTYERPKVRPPAPPRYRDLIGAHVAFLREGIAKARAAGVGEERIVIDPGIAFGKTHAEDLEVLRHLEAFASLGAPVLVAASRKDVIGAVLGGAPPGERLFGTAAVVALAIASGADIVRVHDVAAMGDVARVADAFVRG